MILIHVFRHADRDMTDDMFFEAGPGPWVSSYEQ